MTAARDRRILKALTAADALLRAGVGNPHHDAEGKFASAGGEGGHHGPGKHHARNARRRRRLKALRKRHRAERREHVRYERSERKGLAHEHARERKALDREHAGRLRRHEKTAPARHARVDAEHARKRERIGKGEEHAHAVKARHDRERAEFEAAAGQHGHLHAANERLYESQRKALKDRGGSKEEHAALEQRIAEHREKFADPHAGLREAMDERHGREREEADAFLAKSGTLRERLERQAAAKHGRIDRTPARLEKRHAADRAEMEARHADEREELRERHSEERGEIRARQRHERARVRGKGAKGASRSGFDDRRSAPLGPLGIGYERVEPEHAAVSLAGPGGGDRAARRLSPHRTHKAGSAESILRHALRTLGLTAAWRRGELTDAQRLDLLAEVREYARAWLRHEAEQLIRHYGRAGDGTGDEVSRRGAGPGVQAPGDDDRPTRGVLPPGQGMALLGGPEAGREGLDHDLARALAGRLRHRVSDFFARVRGFLKEAIVAGALALSGGDLDDEDHAEIDRQHAAQAAFLDRFQDEVRLNPPPELSEPSGLALVKPMTAAEFAKRASDYAGAAWVGAQAVNRAAVIRGGHAVAEARFHRLPDPEGHACAVCLGESQKGWSPINSLLPVGDSTCLGIFCDCYFAFKLDDGSIFITARGWEEAA